MKNKIIPPLSLSLSLLPDSPIGPIAAAATDGGLFAVSIGVQDLQGWGQSLGADEVRTAPAPHPVISQLREYFDGARRTFELVLDLRGCTHFQRSVYEQVLAIPYGQTRTYAEIAVNIRRPGATRAVGRANATNPLAIVVPCHRLVGADGSLRGYAAPGGVETKAWLLSFEMQTGAPKGV